LIEGPSLYPHLTGRENLEISRRLLDAPRARIDEVLEVFQLAPDADRLVRTYSLGMRQRLGLALALVGDPKLLILDEPANGLDPAGVHGLRDLLRRLAQSGVTIFLSSHLLSEVEQVADRIAILNNGHLLFEDTLASFQASQQRRMTIRVDRVGDAADLLRKHGWMANAAADGTLCAQTAQAADSATITSLLVHAGFAVHHVSEEQPTLETLFLNATGGARPGASS
jgi:ABC-2 type transport system ATP-binding protein